MFKKIRSTIALSALSLLTLGPSLRADIVLYPSAATNVIGNTSTSAPGFGTSSWQANATSAGAKSELYILASALFAGSVKISDIASVSYWTNKPGNSGSPDWTFYLYTAKQASGNEASWYHTRLNSEPYLTGTPSGSDPSNAWHQWSTDDASNPMRFYDAGRDGGVYGTYTDPTLATLQGGAVTWSASGNTVDYRDEAVSLFSLQTGSAWADGFTGLVDGVTITLKDGEVARVNLEAPVPEPASLLLLATVCAGAFGTLRRRLRS